MDTTNSLVVDRRNAFKTEVKAEPVRTCASGSAIKVKDEPIECVEEWSIPTVQTTVDGGSSATVTTDEQKEMVEFLQEIQRDW